MIREGHTAGLHFELEWEAPREQRGLTASDATRGRLVLGFGTRVFWGRPHSDAKSGFEWTWIDLLEHLADRWLQLAYEEHDPVGLDANIENARAVADERFRDEPGEIRDRQETLLFDFLEAHNLSAAFHGAFPEPVWWLREGQNIRISTRGGSHLVRATEALTTMECLGSTIAARVESLAAADPRGTRAVRRWQSRSGDGMAITRAATGLSPDAIRQITGGTPPPAYFDFEGRDPTESELLAVARMGAAVGSPEVIRQLVDQLRRAGQHWTKPLDDASREARAVLEEHRRATAYDQGQKLAAWLRRRTGLSPEDRAAPMEMLKNLGVRVKSFKLQTESIDAVSCWTTRRGPLVLVNSAGPHGKGKGRRATLAHELGHLLIDRDNALPAGEVLGGRVPARVEARARAFAAELLLPMEAAGSALARAEY